MDLADLTDLVAASPLTICPDTGVAHLATATRTPSIVLFGPQSPKLWGPPETSSHRVIWRPDPCDGSAPADRPHPALLRITPAEVLRVATRMLEENP